MSLLPYALTSIGALLMIAYSPEIKSFSALRRYGIPLIALSMALYSSGCSGSDGAENTSATAVATSPAAEPNALTDGQAPIEPNGVVATTPPKAESTSQATETSTQTIEAMDAMDYRQFEKLDNASKLLWRFSVIDNDEFIGEGVRWDLQKSNYGENPDYYKPNSNGEIFDNYYVVVKPSLENTPQQILDLDNLALRYGVWFLIDNQQKLDHNKLNKFINTQFYDAQPGSDSYEHYQNMVAAVENFIEPVNITNALRTGAEAGEIVSQTIGQSDTSLPTMTFPVDFWRDGTIDFSADVTYVLARNGESSLWQRASIDSIDGTS
jgi:hypothetical protein